MAVSFMLALATNIGRQRRPAKPYALDFLTANASRGAPLSMTFRGHCCGVSLRWAPRSNGE